MHNFTMFTRRALVDRSQSERRVAAQAKAHMRTAGKRWGAGYLPQDGLLAFNIKEEFLDERYAFGFAELIRRMVRARLVRVEATRRYRHRLSATGDPLYYLAVVATKLAEVPRSMLVEPS